MLGSRKKKITQSIININIAFLRKQIKNQKKVEPCKTLLQPHPQEHQNSSWAVEPRSPESETVKEGYTPVHKTRRNLVWQEPSSDLSITAEHFDYDKKGES